MRRRSLGSHFSDSAVEGDATYWIGILLRKGRMEAAPISLTALGSWHLLKTHGDPTGVH